MKRLNILITGGAGFIGTHLAERLCDNHKITIFDNLRRDSMKEAPRLWKHKNVKFAKGDILNKKEVARAIKGCEIIMHLAAIAGVSSYYKEPAETLRVNLIGTVNLLESCMGLNIKKFVYFSTSEVYGQDALNAKEESPYCVGPITDLRWTYAISKIAGESLVVRYGEKYGFKAFVVRPFNIYGPRQTGEGAISNFLRAILYKKPIIINGDGSPIRSWCYISDCVGAVQNLLANDKLKSGAFNIGNPDASLTTLELAKLISAVVNEKVPFVFKKMKMSEIRVRVPNIEKAKTLLGFDPKIGLKEGLELTYQYYKGQKER